MKGRVRWLIGFGVLNVLACNFVTSQIPGSETQETRSAATQSALPLPTSPVSTGAEPATPVPSPGQTYYVDPAGSDANDGSAAAPWQTIQHAAQSVAPGDTILLQSGEYPGARVETSGRGDAWITLKAAPGAQALINEPGPNNQHDSNLEFETWDGDGIVAYWLVEGLEVADAPNWGIDMRGNESNHSHHFIIRANSVHDNGLTSETTGIFTAFVDDVVIENNESYANGEHGIYLSNSGDRFTIRGNRLHHNANCGLHMNGDLSQGGDGVISAGHVEANLIYENGIGGCSAINMDGVVNTLVRNNLLYQNHAGGISIFQQDGAVCSQNNQVLNNTIVMAEDGRWAINLSDTSCTGNKLFNNIIYSYHESRGSILIPAAGIDGFESDFNAVMNRFSADDDNSVISLAEWQALGYDGHSFVAVPGELFVNPDQQNYHLLADSPAVDAGTEIAGLSTDLEGNPRPQGDAVDIGALEFSAMTPSSVATAPTGAGAQAEGVITYSLDGRVYRLAALEGAEPEDISLALDRLSAGADDILLNSAPDGSWLALTTGRFDPECAGWPCLAVVSGDLSIGEAVRIGDLLVHPEGLAVISSGGTVVVYPAPDGPHPLDLWAVVRQGNAWNGPRLLTGGSPFAYHGQPAISSDGSAVVFDCGDEPYGAEGTAICEVGTDGSSFRIVLSTADAPAGYPGGGALHHPDYAPDGSVVFEGDWDGERIWRLLPGASQPVPVTSEFGNDNSPCVLPDGRIVSLWLDRPDGEGFHEIKVMAADGSSYFMALSDADVLDAGLGCAG